MTKKKEANERLKSYVIEEFSDHKSNKKNDEEKGNHAYEISRLKNQLSNAKRKLKKVTQKYEKTHKALQSSNEEINHWFDLSLDLICISDKRGRYKKINPRFTEVLGWKISDIETRSIWDDLHDTKESISIEVINKRSRNGKFFSFENQYKCKNGSKKWVLWNYQQLPGGVIYAAGRDITIDKRIQEALKLTQFTMDNAPQSIFRIDKRGKIVYVNDAASENLGYSKLELLKMNIVDIDGNLNKHNLNYFWKKYQKSENESVESRYLTANNRWIPVEINPNYFRYGEGEFVSLFVADISKRKEIFDNLNNSKTIQNMAVQAAGMGIWVWSLEDDIISWDSKMHQIFKCKKQQKINCRFIKDCVSKSDWALIEKIFNHDILHKDKLNFECKIQRTDDSIREIAISAIVKRNESGRAVKIVGSCIDITQKKNAEKKLKLNEERLSLAVRGTSDGIWDWNIAEKTVWWSPRYYELLGYNYKEIRASTKNFNKAMVHKQDQVLLMDAIKNCFELGIAFDLEYRIKHKNGHFKWFRSRATVIRDKNGMPVRMAGSISDIHQQKQAENSLKRSLKELEQFAYVATHDLRAPIVNLQALVDIYKSLNLVNDENEDLFNKIDESVDRIHGTLHDLIGIVALRKTIDDSKRRINFQKTFEKITATLEEQIKINDVLIKADFSKAKYITYLPGHINSIMQNLITNAIKYRSPNRNPQIDIFTLKEDDYITLTVKDNGKGIKKDRQGQIFQLFQRLDESVEGKGIGLYAVKSQVESNGGKIEVQSRVGSGSTFKVYLKPINKKLQMQEEMLSF